MMDIPTDVLETLKCCCCEGYLSRGPVYLQHDGAAVCGQCFTPERPATRNTQYEATAKLLRYPCKNRELGCLETVPFAEEEEELAHEAACKHRLYVCPVLGSARCDWMGPRAAILVHCRTQHPSSVRKSPCTLTHDFTRSSQHNYLVSAFHLLFLLHTKVCVSTSKIFHSIRVLEGSVKASDFFFNVDIKRNDELLSKRGQVADEGCLKDTSLALDTDGLLDVLGGFDGTTFTVTVKRRRVRCSGCAGEVFQYREEDGWRCENCPPARRACENEDQGCQHTDITLKCWKHEAYFCRKRTWCYVCGVDMCPDSLSEHYGSAHQDITRRAGSTWRATETGDQWHVCLVSSVAGTVVCKWTLNNSRFMLEVYTQVSSEQLSEFRCETRVTDPVTGHARTFSPDAVYTTPYDWRIIIKKAEFVSWNNVFDICLDITRM